MRKRFALIAAAVLAACAPQTQAPNSDPNAAAAPAGGTKWKMASIVGIGDVIIGDTALQTNDGQIIPIQKVEEGVYLFPNSPSKLTNGQNFCFSKPVSYFTWHKHAEGLWVMNVGDWLDPPKVPDANTWEVEGGCALSTYQPA